VVQPPNAQDVGGSMGERSVRISIHGARTTDAALRQEGMIYNGMTPGTNYGSDGLEGAGRGYYVNPLAVNEILIDAGTMGSAEYGLGGPRSRTRSIATAPTAWPAPHSAPTPAATCNGTTSIRRCSIRGCRTSIPSRRSTTPTSR
jgi:hypothetical protein